MMKKVYICSPLGGDVADNLEQAKRYTKYALMCGTAPVVPHFYALCLDDRNAKEREIGMAAGLSLLWFCDEIWVFGNTVTDGMKGEISFCKNLNIRIRHVTEAKSVPRWEEKQHEKKNDEITGLSDSACAGRDGVRRPCICGGRCGKRN